MVELIWRYGKVAKATWCSASSTVVRSSVSKWCERCLGWLLQSRLLAALSSPQASSTLEAGKFAKGKPLELMDGEQLAALIDAVQREQVAPLSLLPLANLSQNQVFSVLPCLQ